MENTTDSTSGGTAQAGSQVQGQVEGQASGADGAQALEPTVRIGDRDVPLSVAERALNNDERFTQTSQELADRRRAVDDEARRVQELSLRNNGAERLVEMLSNPELAARVREVAPELVESLPSKSDMATREVLAENLRLKFNEFARTHEEFDEKQLSGIRSEMFTLAQAGRFDEALAFEDIGLRLYKDDLITRKADLLNKERAEKQKEAEKKKAGAHVQGGGVSSASGGVDLSKLSPMQKLALGHKQGR